MYLKKGLTEGRFVDGVGTYNDVRSLLAMDQGTESLVFNPDTHEFHWREIPQQVAEFQKQNLHFDITVDEEGNWNGTYSEVANGLSGMMIRKLDHVTDQKEYLRRKLRNISYPIYIEPLTFERDQDLLKAAQIKAKIKATKRALKIGKSFYDQIIPVSQLDLFDLNNRKTDYNGYLKHKVQLTVEVHRKRSFKKLNLPTTFEFNHKCLHVSFQPQRISDGYKYESNWVFKCTDIEVKTYKELHEIHRQVKDKIRQAITYQ